jgi:hypothetical protein
MNDDDMTKVPFAASLLSSRSQWYKMTSTTSKKKKKKKKQVDVQLSYSLPAPEERGKNFLDKRRKMITVTTRTSCQFHELDKAGRGNQGLRVLKKWIFN